MLHTHVTWYEVCPGQGLSLRIIYGIFYLNMFHFFSIMQSQCFYIFKNKEIVHFLFLLLSLSQSPIRASPPRTTMLAASLSSNLVIASAYKSATWPSTNLSGKIYVSLTLNSNLSLLVIPGFSLVGRMIDSRLIVELWISVPSSQILRGFNQLLLKGIETRCRGLTPVQVVL